MQGVGNRGIALIEETALLYDICACDIYDHSYICGLEQKLYRLKALYPNHTSIGMMEELINEVKQEQEVITYEKS